MIIHNAVIEVTRRCNMRCAHCLRGDAENLDMTREYLDEFFSKVTDINCLTLTGGEPSLVPEVIDMILEAANIHSTTFGYFYLATNAKGLTPRFVEALMRLQMACTDRELSAVEWSNDIYHEEIDHNDEGFECLKMLRFVNPKFPMQTRDAYGWERFNKVNFDHNGLWKYAGGGIIDEGRAVHEAPATRSNELHEISLDDEGETVEDQEIYLNCKGHIINGCDWSYERQDDPEFDGRICHVRDFSFAALKRYNKRLKKALEV